MRLISLGAAIVLLAAGAMADVVHLKNGNTIRATVVQEDSDYVTVN